MMSTDSTNTPEEKENSPFLTGDVPAVNVSGIPENYVMIDLSNPHEETKSTDQETLKVEIPPEASENTVAAPSAEETPRSEANRTANATMEIIGIRFKKNGKIYYFDPHGIRGKKGDYAIVETARGQEYGEIALENTNVPENEIVPPIRPVLRLATKADTEHFAENQKKEHEAFLICLDKIAAHKLDMKLVEAQYTFDNSKLLFYFTSAGRVDFRDLVKDLASVFRTRIELRQIGIRDEAKLIGGLGSCGRALCCAGFLTDFGQVSIKMAKEQNLSLNSAKISGTCGRLMCCLRYEYETYLEEIRLTPPVDSTVKTPDGVGTVTEIAPISGTVKVRLHSDPDSPPRTYHRDTVSVYQNGKAPTAEDLAQRPRTRDEFAERLAALENTAPAAEIPPRRANDIAQRSEKNDAPGLRRRDDSRPLTQTGNRPTESRGKAPIDDEGSQRNRNHNPQVRSKNPNRQVHSGGHTPHQNNPRKRTGNKTQHRGPGGKNGSGTA